jgi:hypothetical protein
MTYELKWGSSGKAFGKTEYRAKADYRKHYVVGVTLAPITRETTYAVFYGNNGSMKFEMQRLGAASTVAEAKAIAQRDFNARAPSRS